MLFKMSEFDWFSRIAGMNYYYRYYPIEYFYESLNKNGITQLELWTCTQHFDINQFTYQDTKRFLKKQKKYGLKTICVTPEQSNPKPYNLAAKDELLQKKAISYFENTIRVASELESPYISMNSGWNFYNENIDEAFKRSMSNMSYLAYFAKKFDVAIVFEALQPEESNIVNSLSDLQRYIQGMGSDNVFINIDFGAMSRANETIDDYYRIFPDSIRHCHFVDGNPTGHLSWGEGTRDVLEDISRLHDNGYAGNLTFEFAQSRYFAHPFDVDKRAIDFLKKTLN